MKSTSDSETIKKLRDALLQARNSLEAAEQWLGVLLDKHDLDLSDLKKGSQKSVPVSEMNGDEKVIYGEFDGNNMRDEAGELYPIPANYASKSKLIEGDKLKLTVKPDGAFLYKQIELAPRRLVTGKLILEGNQYKVLTEDNTYNVLYASVTFYRGSVGDDVTVIVSEDKDKKWGAIENILPAEELL